MYDNEYAIIDKTITTFESIKHTDENGTDYWNAHDIAKSLGYTKFGNFKTAIERAKEAIANRGFDPEDHIQQCKESFTNGTGGVVSVDGYRMTRMGSYYTAMNGDPSKPEVSAAQGYFIDNTATVEAVHKAIDDIEYINVRDNLKIDNKLLRNTLLAHDVPSSKLGTVLDEGYKGMFDCSAKDLKEELDLPKNTELCDILGPELASIKGAAAAFSRAAINKYDVRGVEDTSKIIYNEHKEMRDKVIKFYGTTPESMLPGENVKSIERKHNKNINGMLKNDKFH